MNSFKDIKINWKYFLIIIVLCSLVGGGILYYYSKFFEFEFLTIKFPLRFKKKVTIVLDKTEYGQGEEIRGESNFWGIVYSHFGYSIQKWEDDAWKDILLETRCSPLPNCDEVDSEEVKECFGYKFCELPVLKGVKKGEFTWNQIGGTTNTYRCRRVVYEWRGGEKVLIKDYGIVEEKCNAFESVSAGRYKVVFDYTAAVIRDKFGFPSAVDAERTEKEFTIK